MKTIKSDLNIGKYLLDEKREIPKSHLYNICCFKQGKKTCRYIFLSRKGYVCIKKTSIKKMIDKKVKENKMRAQGNNCEGLGSFD